MNIVASAPIPIIIDPIVSSSVGEYQVADKDAPVPFPAPAPLIH